MKYQWTLFPAQPVLTQVLSKELKISPLLAQCLVNRGFTEAAAVDSFLNPRLQSLGDPFLLPDMEPAVERLCRARQNSEPVVIFGDYDVDGVTATTLLTEVLRLLGWKVNYYLPHRMDEGYGLSRVGVENCFQQYPTRLLLAVDCGSTANASIEWLQKQGVDVLVLDHHQVSSPPPPALALVNPLAGAHRGGVETLGPDSSREGSEEPCRVPFAELCSAGLAFKLAHALVKRGRALGWAEALACDVRSYLELVALGTIADLVPLLGENRVLVKRGLERLNQTSRPGLLALREVARISKPIGAYEVGFLLAPRLNAAGRLETAADALALLLACNPTEAMSLARQLDARNRERQEIERGIAAEVIASVRGRFNPVEDYVIVEGRSEWHLGVVGIVASRVLQEFYRPAIILGGDAGEWRGSGRSIPGLDLAAALRECDHLLLRHGGHAMAAGLAIKAENLDAFREHLNAVARRLLKPEQLQPALRLDAEATLGQMTFQQLNDLGKLEHTGMGNPPVRLLMCNLSHRRPCERMGSDKKHARFWLTDGQHTREAVMWGVGDGPVPMGRFDVAVAPELRTYNGTSSVQLKILDWRPAG